ncbi:hypothetical protein DY000_02007224 [Brassica cretica]|uniref:Uncharacterized protein n=1 Tax=Brassica cretica TaxID=69181 RepID=A0ABQ7C823_BRACR|nr:hypothetical protein DY000_02007224 [Brassica cretica]
MEDMDFGQTSIDEMTTTSSDESTEQSIDATHQTSIDDTPTEAGKFSLTSNANAGIVLGEPKGQLSNEINQITNEQGTAIPIKINLISKRDHETKLPLQDYLNPGRAYSNRSAIKLSKDDTKKSGVDFVDTPTLKNRYPIPNTDSFTQNYDATIGSRRGKAKFRLNQAFTVNRKVATDLNGKIDIVYSELVRKFDALSEHIKRLDGQVTENATAIKRETVRLPGRTDANSKRQVNDVLLRSGKRLNPSTIEINYAEKRDEVEKTGESRLQPIILDSPNPESETPREKERSNTKEAAIDLEEEEEEL